MQSFIWTVAAMLALAAPPAGHDLTGRVVDQQERPVPGARVAIYTARPREGTGVLCPGCYADCAKEASTDAEGRFRIEALDPSLLFRVLVVAEEYRPVFAADVDPAADPVTLRIEPLPENLDSRCVLHVRVLGANGTPIEGATVDPFGIKTATSHRMGAIREVDPMAVTNDRGECIIVCQVPDVALDLEVSARRYATRIFDVLPTGEKLHELQLKEGVTLTGTLVGSKGPVGGATIGLLQSDHRTAAKSVGEYRIGTDQHGRFQFDNVVPNTEFYVYTKMRDAGRIGFSRVKRFTVGDDGSRHEVGELRLRPAHRLAGHVTLTDGKPIPSGTRLLVSRAYAWDWQQLVLSPDGSFALPGVPEEPLSFSVRVPGYRLAAGRMRHQVLRPNSFGVYVDRDREDLRVYLEPDPAKAAN